jgi:hypothetical protein
MFVPKLRAIGAAAAACMILTTSVGAQQRSAIQFHDSTGVDQTARIGWRGPKNSGSVFIETPNDLGNSVTVKSGKVTAAQGFAGDGSELTNLSVGNVTGMNGVLAGVRDTLSKKADTSWVNTKVAAISVPSVAGIRDTVSRKADTTWVNTKVGVAASYYLHASSTDPYGQVISNETPATSTLVGPVTINAPSSGYVLVYVTADIGPVAAADKTYWVFYGSLSRSRTAEGPVASGVHWNSSNALSQNWAQNALFPVTAGTNSFYLVTWREPIATAANIGDVAIGKLSMSAVFFKNAF